jgi:hypothetical protein
MHARRPPLAAWQRGRGAEGVVLAAAVTAKAAGVVTAGVLARLTDQQGR